MGRAPHGAWSHRNGKSSQALTAALGGQVPPESPEVLVLYRKRE
jgi:hypothetical protein